MHNPWAELGLVFLVGLTVGAGVAALFAFGVTAYAGPEGAGRPPRTRPLGYACFAACGLLVLFGLYLAIPRLHAVF
jgi:hypothetical protein